MRVRLLSVAGAVLVAVLAFAPRGHAGSWAEAGDAPPFPVAAQIPVGSGALDGITGTIDYADVDMYEIQVTGGGTFSAVAYGASPLYLNPILCLFDFQGRGVYANDDAWPPDPIHPPGWSRLPAGDPLTPVVPGIYFLAISAMDLEPVSPGGSIFPCLMCIQGPNTVYGPTGPGGGSPVTGWPGTAFTAGSYTILLTGAEFPPSTTPVPRDTWGRLKALYR